jgi:hypothetical protein
VCVCLQKCAYTLTVFLSVSVSVPLCLSRVSPLTCRRASQIVIAALESTEGFPVSKGHELEKVFKIPLLLPVDREKDASLVAVDGVLKHDVVNLAPSTRLTHSQLDSNVGIVVSYAISVKCNRTMGSKLTVELPFTLTYPAIPSAIRHPSLQVTPTTGGPASGSGAHAHGEDEDFDDYEEVGLTEEFAKFMISRAEKMASGSSVSQ